MTDNLNKLGVASLVCGLVSIFIFPLAFGSAAIIMGYLVMQRVEDKESKAYGNARIGIIAGIAGLALWFISLLTLGYLGVDANNLLGISSEPASAI